MSFTFKAINDGKLKNIIKVKGGRLDGQTISICTDIDKSNTDPDKFNDLTLQDGSTLQMCPPNEGRVCAFVCGASGSGKSHYCSKYLYEYKEKFPDNPIVLVSPITDDSVLNRHNPLRISINDENFVDEDTKLTLEELKDSLVIFDDVCAITDKVLKKGVQDLGCKILVTGRHYNITFLATEHLMDMNSNYIRNAVNEAHMAVIYPQCGTSYHITQMLKKYCGFDNKQIKKILKLPSRNVTIWRNYPSFVVANDCCYMIHSSKD